MEEPIATTRKWALPMLESFLHLPVVRTRMGRALYFRRTDDVILLQPLLSKYGGMTRFDGAIINSSAEYFNAFETSGCKKFPLIDGNIHHILNFRDLRKWRFIDAGDPEGCVLQYSCAARVELERFPDGHVFPGRIT